MNRQLFLQLLEHPDSVSEQESIVLQKFTEDFPYCQTGQLLFVKHLHSQQSVHYPEQLKVAAAYAGDRKVLYNLIHTAPPLLASPQREEEFVLTESPDEEITLSQSTEKNIEQVEEDFGQNVSEIIPEKKIVEEPPSQADIIQKRLQEIAALKASPPAPLQKRGEPAPINSVEEIQESKPIPVKEAAVPSKEIIPEEIPLEKKEEDIKSGKHSFTKWLKTVKREPHVPAQQDKSAPSATSTDEIINRFIETEPRIVPSKAEFYNPIKMAKQSLEERDDIISETLAGIFAEQGNLPRAIEMYRKLMLSNPEKSSFFAARIEKLTQQLDEGK